MKTPLIIACLIAGITLLPAEEPKSDKTLGEKTAEAAKKLGHGTKEAGKAVAEGAKKTADKIADAVTPDKDARRVDVTLHDGRIEMPSQLAAGKTAFVVSNSGKSKHNFAVEGQGMSDKFALNLAPGDSKTLHMDLKAGSYKAFCPVADHEDKGMHLNLVVK